MSLKTITKKSAAIIAQLRDIREAREEYEADNSDVLERIQAFKNSESALIAELEKLSTKVSFEDGVSSIPLVEDFAFKRSANPLYALPGVMKWADILVKAGALKPPSANNVEKLIKSSALPPEAREFVPPDSDRSYRVSVAKPKGW